MTDGKLNSYFAPCYKQVLVEYVKDNYYARFHDPSYQMYI